MESIQICSIEKKGNMVDVFFDVSDGMKRYFLPDHHFFLEYTFDITDVPNSVLIVPALLNLLPLSWLTDSVIWVDEIDFEFYENIYRLKEAFRELYPDYKFGGSLIAARQVHNRVEPKRKALQLFTGGIDATATLIRIRELKPILLNTNGWYKESVSEVNEVYDADFSAISQIAEHNGLEAYFVKSNFANFIIANQVNKEFGKKVKNSWWFGFQHSLAFLGCAMVAAYHFRVSSVFIASSYTFGQYVVCVSDPRIDTCIRCAGISTVHDGYELSRQDKVKLIVQMQTEKHQTYSLRVCSFNTHNCCKCEKCLRSMLALASEGAKDLSQFGFNMEKSLLETVHEFIETSAMELDTSHAVFWKDIVLRMGENFEILQYKDVYEYLKDIDFAVARKKAIWTHYKRDYKDIIRRKIFGKDIR